MTHLSGWLKNRTAGTFVKAVLVYFISSIAGYFICYVTTSHNEDLLSIITQIILLPVYLVMQIIFTADFLAILSMQYLAGVFLLLTPLITLILYLNYKHNYLLGLFCLLNGYVSYNVIYFIWAIASV
ncbi:MAG: hypothetical protein OEZ38_11400 [Gammaproteobacteria bacterium]|nr:hypothetical protein [Gammaproteobacteria bacterium]